MTRRIDTFYPPQLQREECSWCLRTTTDLETEMDGMYVCQDEESCQQAFEARTRGWPVMPDCCSPAYADVIAWKKERDARIGQEPVQYLLGLWW